MLEEEPGFFFFLIFRWIVLDFIVDITKYSCYIHRHDTPYVGIYENNIQIQCNVYPNNNGIFLRISTKNQRAPWSLLLVGSLRAGLHCLRAWPSAMSRALDYWSVGFWVLSKFFHHLWDFKCNFFHYSIEWIKKYE